MDKVKIVFRKNKHNNVIAFFPEVRVNYGNIMSYMHIGQHDEASYEFYLTTRKANENEYADLFAELRKIYDDCELVVKQRINYNDLRDKVWK